MGRYFEYDGIIDADNLCNFEIERRIVREHIDVGDCFRVYGRRNFGKTSLVWNIVGREWERENIDERVLIYVELNSVESLEDISREFTKAFNLALSRKKNLFEKSIDWLKLFKSVRPVWIPPTDVDSFGEFSIRTDVGENVVSFETVIDNIDRLYKAGEFKFFIIMDEFQEIAKIKKAEAKIRDALQCLDTSIPVAIMGSKHHILNRIFNTPKAPFHSWGFAVELGEIDCDTYHKYISSRLRVAKKSITVEASRNLQEQLLRIPEAINRFCDFIARDPASIEICLEQVNIKLDEFLARSRSVYSEMYSNMSIGERKVLCAFAKLKNTSTPTSASFVRECDLPKSTVAKIVEDLLDSSYLYKFEEEGKLFYAIADPFLHRYIAQYKLLL